MRILVIDDEPDIRAAVRTMLAGSGYEVAEAGSRAEAVCALRLVGADLVLCDLFLPDADGADLIRELRRDFPGLKVVAMSGGGTDGAVDLLPEARDRGADGVLYKPFDRVLIRAVIDRVCPSAAVAVGCGK